MYRFCPNCKNKLDRSENFFCSTCGAQLPSDLILRGNAFVRVADFESGDHDRPNLFSKLGARFRRDVSDSEHALGGATKFKMLFVLVALFTLLSYFFGEYLVTKVYNTWLFVTVTDLDTTPTLRRSVTQISSNLDWRNLVLNFEDSLTYVPANAIIVIESNDLYKLGEEVVNIDNSYKKLFDFLIPNSKQHFVLFSSLVKGSEKWTMIFYPKSADLSFPEDIVNAYPWLKFSKNTPVGVVSFDEGLISDVIEAKTKSAKNYTQTAQYASINNIVPRNGKLYVFLSDDSARDALKQILSYQKISVEIKKVVESIVNSGSNFVTIN